MFVSIISSGYGRVYQSVMRNPKITLIAKGLYAYLCAYASNKGYAYPKREKLLKDLGINKSTYLKHLGYLEDAGYIFRQSMYKMPSRYHIKPINSSVSYGIIPKLVVLDSRLDIKAKAIYAYFTSFSGSSGIAYPRLLTILRELNIAEKTYRKYFRQLCELRYIFAEPQLDNGRYAVTHYHMAQEVVVPDELACRKPVSAFLLSGGLPSGNLLSDEITREKGVQLINNNNKIITSEQYHNQYHQAPVVEPIFNHADERMAVVLNTLIEEAHKFVARSSILDSTMNNQLREKAEAVVWALYHALNSHLESGNKISDDYLSQHNLVMLLRRILERHTDIRNPKKYVEAAVRIYLRTPPRTEYRQTATSEYQSIYDEIINLPLI